MNDLETEDSGCLQAKGERTLFSGPQELGADPTQEFTCLYSEQFAR
ncbi:MAG: hypothetical protein IJ719_04890 [Clostridia bacterium]|nr:hypothetical protein [Clostridia bacterium]